MKTHLIPLLLFCLSNTAHAQFQLSLDAGPSFARFNRPVYIPTPTIDFDLSPNVVREEIRAVANEFIALNLEYAPADKLWSFGLRVQYLGRGYQHIYIEEFDNNQGRGTLYRDNMTSINHYIDFMPQAGIRINRNWSVTLGPYVAVRTGASDDNPFVPENERGTRLQPFDAGAHATVRFHANRFYALVQYQHSLRNMSFFDFPYFNQEAIMIDKPHPVSAINVGVGYLIIR